MSINLMRYPARVLIFDPQLTILTLEERGLYYYLLEWVWMKGSIPADPYHLVRTYMSRRKFAKQFASMAQCFVLSEDGLRYHIRDVDERRPKLIRKKALPAPSKRKGIRNKDRFAVLARAKFCCEYCGARATEKSPLEIDHRIPVSEGGSNTTENMVAACWPCNSGKGAILIDHQGWER